MIGGSSPQNLISAPQLGVPPTWNLNSTFRLHLITSRNQLDTRAGLTNIHQIFNFARTYSVYLFISHHSCTQRRAPSYHRQSSFNLSRDQQRPPQKKNSHHGQINEHNRYSDQVVERSAGTTLYAPLCFLYLRYALRTSREVAMLIRFSGI